MLNSLRMIRHRCSQYYRLKYKLSNINEYALQWKMSFNPDPTKQAQEIIFSRKTLQRNHGALC